jgi:hypothetical protein
MTPHIWFQISRLCWALGLKRAYRYCHVMAQGALRLLEGKAMTAHHVVALSGGKDARALADLTPAEKRFLSRRVCWMCEQRLDQDVCLTRYEEWRCTPEQMAERRRKCLETYKPRGARR